LAEKVADCAGRINFVKELIQKTQYLAAQQPAGQESSELQARMIHSYSQILANVEAFLNEQKPSELQNTLHSMRSESMDIGNQYYLLQSRVKAIEG